VAIRVGALVLVLILIRVFSAAFLPTFDRRRMFTVVDSTAEFQLVHVDLGLEGDEFV